MKKLNIVSFIIAVLFIATAIVSCSDNRTPGRTYMPDMVYSRAYEAYAPNDLKEKGINYINYPVDGTIRRGDLFPYTLLNDSNGYKMSAGVKNPITSMTAAETSEAQRLFMVNCAICHGANMDAQGPLAVSGKVGGIANLKLPLYVNMPEGTMFHSVTYGKNNMGSYASQLSRKQRWMVIRYVKSEQTKGAGAGADSTAAKSGSEGLSKGTPKPAAGADTSKKS